MTTLEALLQAVAASPSDVAPRFILADWLEEHGVVWASLWRDPLLYTCKEPERYTWGIGKGEGVYSYRESGPGDGIGAGAYGHSNGCGMGAYGCFLTSAAMDGDGFGRGRFNERDGDGMGAARVSYPGGDGGSELVQGHVFLGMHQHPG